MVLSIRKISTGRYVEYLRKEQHGVEDYYKLSSATRWFGRGSEALGLSEPVQTDELRAITTGFHPDGSRAKLVQNAGRGRVVGFDLTFSAPKSFSVAFARAAPEEKKTLLAIQNAATHDALRFVEDNATYVRTGRGGAQREQAGMVAFSIPHYVSREREIQIHNHCPVMNVAVRAGGKTNSLSSEEIFDIKMAAGAHYRSSMVHLLYQHGYKTEVHDQGLYELAGVPAKLMEQNSTRAKQVEQYLTDKKLEPTPENKEQAALMTRRGKDEDNPVASIEKVKQEAHELGWSGPELHPWGKVRTQVQERKAVRSHPVADEAFTEAIKARVDLNVARRRMVYQMVQPSAYVETGPIHFKEKGAVLNGAKSAWEENGYRVIGVTDGTTSAARLQRKTGIQSTSLKQLIAEIDWKESCKPLRVGQDMYPTLNSQTVVVVDGVKEFDHEQAGALLTAAGKGRAKVVMIGDAAHLKQPPRVSEEQARQTAQALTRGAARRVLDQHSTFSGKQFLTAVNQQSVGSGISSRRVADATGRFFESREVLEILSHGKGQGKAARLYTNYTTKEQLETEADIITMARTLRDDKTFHSHMQPHLDAIADRSSILPEQKDALEYLASPGKLKVLTGYAGTGKSYIFRSYRQGEECSENEVIGLAFQGKTAARFQSSTGIQSSTIDKFLWDYERGRASLSDRTTVVLEEAGMVGTQRLHRVMKAAHDNRSKIILSGDDEQLQPIEAGGGLGAVQRHVERGKRLTTIFRQKHDYAKEAVVLFEKGEAEKALRLYKDRGLIEVDSTTDGLYWKLIDQWGKNGGATAPEQHLIFTNTNEHRIALNRLAQQKRIERGELGKRYMHVGGQKVYVNEQIMFLKNSRATPEVNNGTSGVVKQVNYLTKEMIVKLEDGRTEIFSTKNYSNITLGYAQTINKGQGVSTQYGYVFAVDGHQNKHSAYTQMSRGIDEIRLYARGDSVDDAVQSLAPQMNRSNKKVFAVGGVFKIREKDQKHVEGKREVHIQSKKRGINQRLLKKTLHKRVGQQASLKKTAQSRSISP